MDADFIQSVARVGDSIEIVMTTGDRFEGVLEGLTLSRLNLRKPDGQVIAVALPTVAFAQLSPAASAVPVASGSPEPPTQVPPAQEPPAQPDPAPDHAPQLPSPRGPQPSVPAALRGDDPAWRAEALAAIAQLPVAPLDMGIYVSPQNRKELERIRNSYENAQKIGELEPRFGRVGRLYGSARHLWNVERGNPEVTRLVGALALLKDDAEAAHHFLTQAAEADDVVARRLMAVSAAHLGDAETARFALLRYFHDTAPDGDPEAWSALLGLLDTYGGRGQLGELIDAPAHDDTARAAVRAALGGAAPAAAPAARPPGAVPALTARRVVPPEPAAPKSRPRPLAGDPRGRPEPTAARSSGGQRGWENQYQKAKYLEHREKNLEAAKAAYRLAIKQNVKRESAAKDLAWLTRRVDGAEAALRVIEHECAGMIQPGHALDNILIDFYTGAKRYAEALEVLDRQFRRTDLTSSRRYHVCHQIAYVKLAHGQDSTDEWQTLLKLSPDNQNAQRGMALALVRRGTTEDLEEAEKLIGHHTDDRSVRILRQIVALRQSGGTGTDSGWVERLLEEVPRFVDSTPPLVTFVMQNYSELAARRKEDRERPVTRRDLNVIAETARQMSGKQPVNSAQAYISAAVLATELGEEGAQRYLCLGLTTLAGIVLDKQEYESAQDLYCAALAVADERDDRELTLDVRSALIGYLRSPDGRRAGPTRHRDRDEATSLRDEVGRVLWDGIGRREPGVIFSLIPPLFADTSVARDLVLDAMCAKPELLEAAARHLGLAEADRSPADQRAVREAWQQAGDKWSRDRRRLEHSLAELQQLSMSENDLESALDRLRGQDALISPSLHEALVRIEEALSELRRFINERSFEERENCLRLADQKARALSADIRRGPTSLAVGLVEPVAARIRALVADTQQNLLATQQPQPELSLALEESSGGQNGVVTVQIKVANALGMAPLESPELTVGADADLFSVGEPSVQLPTAVRGGEHRIEQVKLRVTDKGFAAGAFTLPVTLRFRRRSSDDYATFEATLPVRLARQEEFERIPDPFQDGATGRPVVDPKMFFGRDDLIERIRTRLREVSSPGVGVAIYGQKRAGKSSIAHHLARRLNEDGLPVVDVGNIGDLSPESDDLTGTRLLALLMWRVLEGAHDALARLDAAAATAPLIPEGLTRQEFLTSPEPVHDCARLIERHREGMRGSAPPLIVLIDEFQYIDRWIRMGLLSPSFMQAFKALIERRLFHLVIVGQDALDRLIKGDPNVFGVFHKERVTYLAEPDARALIEKPIRIEEGDRPTSRYREHAVGQIIELTGGSAFYIQRFCSHLVQYMNSERAPVVTEADVERVRDEFLGTLTRQDFDNLESPGYTDPDAFTSEQYQPVLLAVARASRNQPATLQAIREEYRGEGLEELLDDLVLRDVVRRESGAYRIVVRLYPEWLLKYLGASSKAGTP
ncbi:AAA family ATPase [Streptomyces luteolifulvus]|uniref:AAA family ATPase n=1 Tax=Streptomyces luteolifulvus TaxID=2615112 RepID=A0A6H9V0U9_9ACTN|nr:AAA family ATPase [Streptomyces luteolifulvus]KAB1147697.1 AAA family ATPase [Streptomyces luteolifulvus]